MSLIAERYRTDTKARAIDTGISYQLLGGNLVPIADNTRNYITKGYGFNDQVYSIINLIADKIRIAPWSIYEVADESSLKSYVSHQSKKDMNAEDLRRVKQLQAKAFTTVKTPGKWGDLLLYPNEQDTFQDMVVIGAVFKMLTGNKYIWGDIIPGGANKGIPNALWPMPSQWMQIVATSGFPFRILGFEMFNFGIQGVRRFDREEVLHEKYYDYDANTSGSHLVGMSPFRAGLRMVNQDNAALDVGTAKMQNGGLEAIIYVDDANVTDRKTATEQTIALKNKLASEYTGKDNWGKIAASGYKVGVANLGLTPVELAIIEAQKWDLRRICNLLGGVPSQLANDPDNKTYNNQKEGEKALTSRSAMSHLTSFRDSINRQAHQFWGLPKNWAIDFDMTVYGELQQDMGDMMKWLEPVAKLTGMSPNRILDLMGLEKVNDKLFDEPWIRPEQGVPQSEWEINPVDNALNGGQ